MIPSLPLFLDTLESHLTSGQELTLDVMAELLRGARTLREEISLADATKVSRALAVVDSHLETLECTSVEVYRCGPHGVQEVGLIKGWGAMGTFRDGAGAVHLASGPWPTRTRALLALFSRAAENLHT